nr:MAG TPA: hypothetical protein [Caudoviricetes sp.]
MTLLAQQSLCGIVKALRYHTHSPPRFQSRSFFSYKVSIKNC